MKKLKEEARKESDLLYNGIILMKSWMLKHSINNVTEIEKRIVNKCHDKKFRNLIDEKNKTEGTQRNPNKRIWNFSTHILSNDERTY